MLDPDSADYPSSAAAASTLDDLEASLVECRACPRLVAWRESVAVEKRAAFRDESTGDGRCLASAIPMRGS